MRRLRRIALVSTLAAMGLASLVGGSWALVQLGVDRLLERSAMQTASHWAGHSRAAGAGFERLAAGKPLTEAQIDAIERMEEDDDVFRWKVFDADGELVVDSRYFGPQAAGEPLSAEAVLEEERHQEEIGLPGPHASAEEGDGVTVPLHYAQAYRELVEEGERVGFLEVYVDQTVEHAELTTDLLLTAVALMLLAIGASIIPIVGLLWQTRGRRTADAARLHAVSHDLLTGLLNRAAISRAIDERTEAEGAQPFHLLALDVRALSAINQEHGHAFGDDVIRLVAEQTRRAAGAGATVARLGADEFAVLACDRGSRGEAAALARRLSDVLCRQLPVDGVTIPITVDIGVAGFPRDGQRGAQLLKAVELALHQAKSDDPGTIRTFEPAMEQGRLRRLEIERRLRRAVEDGDFRLAYQPLYRLADGALAGFEALLRLDWPGGREISPAEVISVAEETKLIIPLSGQTLRRACRAAAGWPGDLFVAVNLSPVDFDNDGPVRAVRRALALSGLPPERLEIELTESALAEDAERVALELDTLNEMGVGIALDDFGTGYSSLSYVWKFPFHKLKIDRSFVSNLESEGERSRQMLQTVVALGEVLGLEVTAEGVETERQADEVRRLRVEYVQGFLFGRPMPEEDVPEFVRRHASLDKPARRADTGR